MILGEERDLQVLWTKLIYIYIYGTFSHVSGCTFFFFLTNGEGLRRGEKGKQMS